VLASLGDLGLTEREPAQAARYYEESLAVYHSLGASPGIARCLVGLAAIAEAQQQPVFAAQLLGAADHLRDTLGMPRHPVERPGHAELLDQLRTRLGQTRLESECRAGADDVLAQVMLTGVVSAEQQLDAGAPASSGEIAPMYPDDLSAREVEVLRLLA